MPNRTVAPPIKQPIDFELNLPLYQQATLRNGVPVYYLHGGEEAVMQMELIFGAGTWHEQQPLVAAATNALMLHGTATRTAFDISEEVDYYGSYLSRNCFSETANLVLNTLSKHLGALLPLLTDVLTQASFPQDELDLFVKNSQQRLQVNLMKSDFVANRQIDVLLYGEEHPYGRYTRHEDFDGLTRDLLLQYYQQHYQHGQCMVMVAGKLPEGWLQQLDAAIGHLPLQPLQPQRQEPLLNFGEAPAERVHRTSNDPKGVQGAIRIARRFPNRHHPDTLPCLMLNMILGGYFGSRLMSNIREDKGYTYGIHSHISNLPEQSSWMIGTEAGRDVCEATISEVYHEMERLRNEPVDAEELQLVRNYFLGVLLGDLDGPMNIMTRWKSYQLLGIHDHSLWNRMIHTIRTISAEELQVLANRYLHPEYFYELVVV